MNENAPLADWERELLEGDNTPTAPARPAVWLTITAQMVVIGLLDILDRFGHDHVATKPGGGSGCIYAVKNESNALVPVCIVGQFFSDLGILAALLINPNDPEDGVMCANPANFGAMGADDLGAALRARGIALDGHARRILRKAQSEQDNGVPWGIAVETAFSRAQREGWFTFPEVSLIDRAKVWQENL